MSYGYREERRRLKELERQKREQEKLNQREQAQLEVEESIRKFEDLVSFHKQCCPSVKWTDLATELSPIEAIKQPFDARQKWRLNKVSDPETDIPPPLPIIAAATLSVQQYVPYQIWEKRKQLATRILSKDTSVYSEALEEYSLLNEVIPSESDLTLKVHSWNQLEVSIKLGGSESIPSEAKSLTSSGKVSIKKVPAARLQEIYQDHICSAILRIAREIFAILPVDTILSTTYVPLFDSSRGSINTSPIYSIYIKRSDLSDINYDKIDPSDAIDRLPHKGDFKASRKFGAFQPIVPLKFDDTHSMTPQTTNLSALIKTAETLNTSLKQLLGTNTETSI